ncbi:MAG: hypothetical protein AAF757_07790, partial [Cyanobacteria bacterium P01_D01_bin.116]
MIKKAEDRAAVGSYVSRRYKYEGFNRDLIMLLRIYFLPYLKAGASDLMAEDRELLFVSKLALFPS